MCAYVDQNYSLKLQQDFGLTWAGYPHVNEATENKIRKKK